MDGITRYNRSLDELKKLERQLGMDTLTISFAKLDAHTQSALREALIDVIEDRKGKVIDVIQGASVG